MKHQILEAVHSDLRLIIEGEFEEGAYIYIYKEDGQWWDYLQDDISMCKEFAFEEFEVPIDLWHEYKGKRFW